MTNLSGSVGIIDNEDVTNKMSFPMNLIYKSGDFLCHQKADRSFFLNQNQMPFCSRCTAIWVGLTVGLFLTLFLRFEIASRFIVIAIISMIPIGIDGIGQLLGFWESTQIVRAITGSLIGFICGVSLGSITDELKMLKKSKSK